MLVCEDRLDLWWRCESQTDEIIHFETLIGLGDGSARVSSSYRVLAGKQVAVVGCGSAGSKIAASLARSGVGRFILVDDDVLLPENLVRNELDWRDVGSHKADALSARLKLVNPEVALRLRTELRIARRVEIGGLLLGERLSAGRFRIVDFTVQREGGTHVHFVRDPERHANRLAAFFERTGRDYTRFNYLGEWHSHPSFLPTPSPSDIVEMSKLIADPGVGASFLVLLILRLRPFRRLIGTASLFVRDHCPTLVKPVWLGPVKPIWFGAVPGNRIEANCEISLVFATDNRRDCASD